MAINRKSGFFENRGGKKLFYTLTMPETYSAVWVFCNPFIEEKVYTASVYKYFSDYLAKNGLAVMRFDYLGDGDSEGTIEDVDLDYWRNDIIDACQYVGSICGNSSLNLFGLRLGASLAWDVANMIKVEQILLWEPILDGEDYLNQLLRYNLTTQLATYGKVNEERSDLIQRLNEGATVNVLGYEIHQSLANTLSNLQLKAESIPECKVNIVALSLTSSLKPPGPLSLLVKDTSADLVMVKARPFWHEPRFIDVRQQALVDASMELVIENENNRCSVCN